jgi:hypothetical protein
MKTPVSNLKDPTPEAAPQAMMRAGRGRMPVWTNGADLDRLRLHEEIGANPIRHVSG